MKAIVICKVARLYRELIIISNDWEIHDSMLFLRALEHRLSSPIACYAFKLGLIYKLDSALSLTYGDKLSHFYFGQMKGTLEMVFVILFDIHLLSIFIFLKYVAKKLFVYPFFFISLWKRNCQNLCLCLLCVCLCVYDCCSSYRNICCGPYTSVE